jgi:hypothetical protein
LAVNKWLKKQQTKAKQKQKTKNKQTNKQKQKQNITPRQIVFTNQSAFPLLSFVSKCEIEYSLMFIYIQIKSWLCYFTLKK